MTRYVVGIEGEIAVPVEAEVDVGDQIEMNENRYEVVSKNGNDEVEYVYVKKSNE